jgi:hypothetical protein
MTLEKCAAAGSVSGYTWLGVEYSSDCSCGTGLDADSLQASEGDCAMTCSGDHAQTCGGSNRLDVFAKPVPANDGPKNLDSLGELRYQGCRTDDVGDRALKNGGYCTNDMSLERCAERCKDYLYFGPENACECYCGNKLGGQAGAAEKE